MARGACPGRRRAGRIPPPSYARAASGDSDGSPSCAYRFGGLLPRPLPDGLPVLLGAFTGPLPPLLLPPADLPPPPLPFAIVFPFSIETAPKGGRMDAARAARLSAPDAGCVEHRAGLCGFRRNPRHAADGKSS